MTPYEVPSDDAIQVFMQCLDTSRSVIKECDRYLKKTVGLSIGKFAVLMVLHGSNRSLTAMEIAKRTGTRPNNITILIRALKKQGLITVDKSNADRRFVHVALTDEGYDVMNEAMPDAREFIAKAMTSFDKDDIAVLENLITRLRENLAGKH